MRHVACEIESRPRIAINERLPRQLEASAHWVGQSTRRSQLTTGDETNGRFFPDRVYEQLRALIDPDKVPYEDFVESMFGLDRYCSVGDFHFRHEDQHPDL